MRSVAIFFTIKNIATYRLSPYEKHVMVNRDVGSEQCTTYPIGVIN